MWTSIYIANNKEQAEKLRTSLQEEGILSKVRKVGGMVETEHGIFEVQVMESEAEEAQAVNCRQTEGF